MKGAGMKRWDRAVSWRPQEMIPCVEHIYGRDCSRQKAKTPTLPRSSRDAILSHM